MCVLRGGEERGVLSACIHYVLETLGSFPRKKSEEEEEEVVHTHTYTHCIHLSLLTCISGPLMTHTLPPNTSVN